jgi:hypothetical protein
MKLYMAYFPMQKVIILYFYFAMKAKLTVTLLTEIYLALQSIMSGVFGLDRFN